MSWPWKQLHGDNTTVSSLALDLDRTQTWFHKSELEQAPT